MEPIRFADILFVFLTLVITFIILWLVNKARKKAQQHMDDVTRIFREKQN